MSTSLDMPVALTATVLVMGGNSNPQGVEMDRQLDGYFSTREGTPYSGYDYTVVPWSAQIPLTGGANGMTYDASQAEGLVAITTAVGAHNVPGDALVVVGYSSSAAVVTKLLRRLHADREAGRAAPSPDDLTVVLLGNPNRPNGGVLARFPGVHIGEPVGVTFDGATPQTEYTVTDISWQYDGISDFPNHTSNMPAVANAMMGFLTLHGQYYAVDPTDPRQVLSDVTVGTTRYITLRGDLPLLAPFYLMGVPRPMLATLDAALRAEIERGYDRTISPDTPTPATSKPDAAHTRAAATGVLDATPAAVDRSATAGKKSSARTADTNNDDAASDDGTTPTTPATTSSSPTSSPVSTQPTQPASTQATPAPLPASPPAATPSTAAVA